MSLSTLPISVVVPVLDEEAGLPACLARLGRFAEVIVVDSGSVDRTAEVAREHGARVVDFHWNGHYPKKRNWLLLEHPPACEWVLFLDADEIVDDAFCEAAGNAVGSGAHAGYWLNYTTHFLGRRLRHGVPQRKLALFRVGDGLYERIDERRWSDLDMEIHEHPQIDGSVGEIPVRIDHRDDRGLARFIDRHRRYASWEAERLEALRAEGQAAWERLTARQRTKYGNIDAFWFAPGYFLATYLLRGGFLDGGAGLHYALYKLWYFRTIRLMVLERRSSR